MMYSTRRELIDAIAPENRIKCTAFNGSAFLYKFLVRTIYY